MGVSKKMDTALGMGIAVTALIILVVLACIPLIIFVERAQRRIPVNYAKRVQGRKMMGGQSTYIPLKVNAAGVIPIWVSMPSSFSLSCAFIWQP